MVVLEHLSERYRVLASQLDDSRNGSGEEPMIARGNLELKAARSNVWATQTSRIEARLRRGKDCGLAPRDPRSLPVGSTHRMR